MLEFLVLEELLFASRKNEFCTTVETLDVPVNKRHLASIYLPIRGGQAGAKFVEPVGDKSVTRFLGKVNRQKSESTGKFQRCGAIIVAVRLARDGHQPSIAKFDVSDCR
ncbi:MAG TPA: hypothetical protein VGI45_32100 [Terracidiphilus sp.]